MMCRVVPVLCLETRKRISRIVAALLLLLLIVSGQTGCEPSGPEPFFVLQEEIQTVSPGSGRFPWPKEKRPGEAVAIFDANDDGLEDFIIVSGSDHYFVFLTERDWTGKVRFRGRCSMIGTRVHGKRSISKGLGLHDFNNDGALDLHLCVLGKGTVRTAWRPSEAGLFRQAGYSTQVSNRDGTFTYRDFGVDGDGTQRTAIFEDFDGDGRFDCYISTSPYYGPWYSGSPLPCQLYPGVGDSGGYGPDILRKVVFNAPADFWADEEGNGKINFKSAVIRDFDNDGHPDMAAGAIADVLGDPSGNKVSSEDGPAYQGDWNRGLFVFRNLSSPGHIRFEDVSHSAVQNPYGNTDQMHIYSVVPADLDRDGRLDLIVNGIRAETLAGSLEYMTAVFRLYRNDSTPGKIKFTDLTEDSGLSFLNDLHENNDWRQSVTHESIAYRYAKFTHAAAIDIDNDGDLDIFGTSPYGIQDDPSPPGAESVRGTGWVFLNDGSGKFAVADPHAHGLHAPAKDFSYGDLNNDGKIDLVTVKPNYGTTLPGGDYVFLNNIRNGNRFIKIKVTSDSNKLGIGTKVTVLESGTQTILGFDEVRTDFRYRSKKSTTLHFGAGQFETVDVKLTGRNGRETIHSNLNTNAEHTLSLR